MSRRKYDYQWVEFDDVPDGVDVAIYRDDVFGPKDYFTKYSYGPGRGGFVRIKDFLSLLRDGKRPTPYQRRVQQKLSNKPTGTSVIVNMIEMEDCLDDDHLWE